MTATQPRFLDESYSAACSRVPELRDAWSRYGSIAKVLELVDSLPGYELFQYDAARLDSYGGGRFIFRRLDPAATKCAGSCGCGAKASPVPDPISDVPGLPVPERGEVPGAFIVGASVHACQWDVEQVYTNDGDTERIATLDSQLHAQVLADALNLETAHGLSMPAAYALVKGLVPALCDALQSCIDGLDGTPSAEEVAIVRSGLISFLSRLQEGFPTSA